MNTLHIEAVSGLHPYGTLNDLYAAVLSGSQPFLSEGPRDCLPTAFDSLKNLGLPLRRMPRLAKLALAAALLSTSFPEGEATALRNGAVIVATSYGSVQCSFDFMDSILADGPDLASPTAFSHSVTNMAAAMISQYLTLTGPALTITDAGGQAFKAALFAAVNALQSGRVDSVMLWAVEERHPVFETILAKTIQETPHLEGALLFILRRQPRSARLALTLPKHSFPSESISFVSGHENDSCPHARNLHTVYGHGPLAPAWDLALACIALQTGGASNFTMAKDESRPTLRCRSFDTLGKSFDLEVSLRVSP